MKSIKLKRVLTQYLFFASVIILVMGSTGCTKEPGPNPEVSKAQLIVWLNPEYTPDKLDAWISANIIGEFETQSCLNCDNELRLLTGPGIETYTSGHLVSGGAVTGEKRPVTGKDGPVYFCYNYSLNFNINFNGDVIDSLKGFFYPLSDAPSYQCPTKAKVAVFDTGLEPNELSGSFRYRSDGRSCINNAELGWNFAGNNFYYDDDHDKRHGTTVTRYITEQVRNYGINRVGILPVKTHDSLGGGTLFDILCGFAYAKERGVKIINASFGFYLPRLEILDPITFPVNTNVLLLRAYIKHYLTENNILLVAAAGNTDDNNELQTFRDHGLPIPSNLRDLDQVSFYPASLARDTAFPNVIAVTTLDPEGSTVSPNQNFSTCVVDIGVKADAVVEGTHYIFKNPRSDRGATTEGSSFAAPIVTGKLCANYHLFEHLMAPGLRVNKAAIIDIFLTHGIIGRTASPGLVRNNNVMERY